MAGIRAKQFEVFKIGTDMLKMNDWDLTLSKDKAMSLNLLVSLFDSQMFDSSSKGQEFCIKFGVFICRNFYTSDTITSLFRLY